MAKNFSIENSKSKLDDVKTNLESKKKELKNLEKNKKKLLEAGTELESSSLDSDSQKLIMEYINDALDDNAKKGEELSEEMNEDFSTIEEITQDVDDSLESNQQNTSKLKKTKGLLDKIGVGGRIDDALSELNENKKNLGDLRTALKNTEKELSGVSQKLSSL